MNFKYKFMQFMSGRYGTDNLFYVLFAAAALIYIINWFVRSLVLQIVIWAILTYALFRVLSRNVTARKKENKALTNFAFKTQEKMKVRRQRKADYTHVYKKCPRCHAVLRLPRRKGKHTTVCPKCQNKFKVYVFKA